ncbi:unnamed protein product [Caenorhabditis brenneri]
MDEDFDIEVFTKNLKNSHPEIVRGLEEPSTSIQFETDEFERNLVSECPELAKKICELDEKIVSEAQKNVVSKKQQTRDRHARLEAMMAEGRTVTEMPDATYHEKILETNGPMELLAKAVKNKKRVEIRVREAVRMDRIFRGIPTTFDEHFNVVVQDATETYLRGRKSQKEVGKRKLIQSLLPDFMKWNEGGQWPIPLGENRILENRFHRSCFIKGDSVILIRALE